MDQIFADGRIVDIVFAFMLLEAVVLLAWRKKIAPGLGGLDIAALMAPGVALLLALRAALVGATWEQIAGWLILSLFAHIFDLTRRLSHR